MKHETLTYVRRINGRKTVVLTTQDCIGVVGICSNASEQQSQSDSQAGAQPHQRHVDNDAVQMLTKRLDEGEEK
jgi:hypothetical protein